MDRVTIDRPLVRKQVSVFPIVVKISTSILLAAHAKNVAPTAKTGACVQQTATYVPVKEATD